MKKLAGFRVTAGFTQAAVAKELGITQGAISVWERGDGAPNVDKIQQLANLYKVTVQDIFEACLSVTKYNAQKTQMNQNHNLQEQ